MTENPAPAWWTGRQDGAIRWRAAYPLAAATWLKAGGDARWLARVGKLEDLIALVKCCPRDVPLQVIGAGSNLLIRDGGVTGVTIQLTGELAQLTVQDDVTVQAMAGARDRQLAELAAAHGISGFAPFATIPGTIGGALRMNAGAYKMETADRLLQARFLDRQGQLHTLEPAALDFGYRSSGWDASWIAVSARFAGSAGDIAQLRQEIASLQQQRKQTQPAGIATGGSTFKNPQTGPAAWKLLVASGCQSLHSERVSFSSKHANFLVHHGQATALEIEALVELARDIVFERTGLSLAWEIRRWGRLDPERLHQLKQNLKRANGYA